MFEAMTASSSEFLIRPMKKGELNLALEWAAAEGWNPGIDDAESFYAADPQGFLVGELDGEAIAVISAVKYGTDFGFLGFYIVKPEYRGQGYGWQIWQAAISRLHGRNIGLDGVVDQQDNYRKSGFVLAHRNIRYQGDNRLSASLPEHHSLMPIDAVTFEALMEYEQPFFAAARADFMQAWLSQPHSVAMVMLHGDDIVGFGAVRACQKGSKIGPLFADSKPVASALLAALAYRCEGPLFLDVPACNHSAVELAEELGMQRVFETARMYTQYEPDISLQRTYGITSFELG